MKIEKLLKEVDEFCIKNFIPNINEDVGKLLTILIRSSKSKNILEVGTAVGYSTIWLALAVKENKGKVTTIEMNKDFVKISKENFRKANLNNIKILEGNALEVLKSLKGKFDFVFIDATKNEYLNYLKLISSNLNKPSLIVADNAISHEQYMLDYLDYVRNNKSITSVLVPIRAGVEVSYLS